MGAEELLREYDIPMVTGGHKHSTNGWINVDCPFCNGSKDFHLGIHSDLTACHCWRCGKHNIGDALSKILNISKGEIWTIIRRFQDGVKVQAPEAKVSIRPFKFPEPNFPLNKMGKNYLRSRGFDPTYIAEEWGVFQTGPVAKLDRLSYEHRLLIPIEWNGEVVSFQSRDLTNRSKRKYLVCPPEREKINQKQILYGKQAGWRNLSGLIVVEGVADAWRFGEYAAATFGIAYTMDQVLELSKVNDKFIIIYDNESFAQSQARELGVRLRTLGKEVKITTVADDPGNMTQREANELIKRELL